MKPILLGVALCTVLLPDEGLLASEELREIEERYEKRVLALERTVRMLALGILATVWGFCQKALMDASGYEEIINDMLGDRAIAQQREGHDRSRQHHLRLQEATPYEQPRSDR